MGLVLAVVAFDQIIKQFVLGSGRGFIFNSGGVFGLDLTPGWVWVVGGVLLVLTWHWWRSFSANLNGIGWALVVAGGWANAIDRVRFGGVVDFIALGSLPRFNIADLAICLGGGLVFGSGVLLNLGEKLNKRESVQ